MILESLDIIGTFVFAISGTLHASEKRLDLFGGLVISLVTAIGGGTIRDVLLGATPVGWIQNSLYLYTILSAFVVAWWVQSYIVRWSKTLFLFDTIGLGVFALLGMQKSLSLGISPVFAILMGMISAVFGGVLRDVLCAQTPLIFRKEIYATPCLIGGASWFGFDYLGLDYSYSIYLSVGVVIVIRLLAVKYHWQLPQLKKQSSNAH